MEEEGGKQHKMKRLSDLLLLRRNDEKEKKFSWIEIYLPTCTYMYPCTMIVQYLNLLHKVLVKRKLNGRKRCDQKFWQAFLTYHRTALSPIWPHFLTLWSVPGPPGMKISLNITYWTFRSSTTMICRLLIGCKTLTRKIKQFHLFFPQVCIVANPAIWLVLNMVGIYMYLPLSTVMVMPECYMCEKRSTIMIWSLELENAAFDCFQDLCHSFSLSWTSSLVENVWSFWFKLYRGGRGGGRGGYQQRNNYRGGRPDSGSYHRDYEGSRTSEVRSLVD